MRGRAVIGTTLFVALCVAAPGSTIARGAPRPVRALPDLVALPPEGVSGPTTTLMFSTMSVDAPVVVDGCYADERVRKGAERCLRFDGIVGNTGDGAFELAYTHVKGRGISAVQRVYHRDGTFADRFAIPSEFHPTHAHFHVKDFYVARLWQTDATGRRLGGEPVARGDKNGFCPQDSDPLEDDGSSPGPHYTCLVDGPHGARLQVVGISAGWRDVYPFELPDQYVEITGVPDGRYVLEIELDPDDVFVESDDSNNTVCTVLELAGSAASIVEPSVPC